MVPTIFYEMNTGYPVALDSDKGSLQNHIHQNGIEIREKLNVDHIMSIVKSTESGLKSVVLSHRFTWDEAPLRCRHPPASRTPR